MTKSHNDNQERGVQNPQNTSSGKRIVPAKAFELFVSLGIDDDDRQIHEQSPENVEIQNTMRIKVKEYLQDKGFTELSNRLTVFETTATLFTASMTIIFELQNDSIVYHHVICNDLVAEGRLENEDSGSAYNNAPSKDEELQFPFDE